MPNWTPTPWPVPHFAREDIACNCKYLLADYGGMGAIATIGVCKEMHWPWGDDEGPDWEQAKANARRIVACVNACEGIPSSALESGVIGELVEALESGLKMLSVAVQAAGGDPKTHYGCCDMRAALRKARGEAT